MQKSPQERIRTAALELFGERGFKATTIREICKKADVNIALVNYHFKNKKNLYNEIVITTLNEAFEKNPISDFIKPDMPPEEKLKNTIRMILHRLLGPNGLGKNRASVNLVSRELTNPTEIMDTVFAKYISKMVLLFRQCIKGCNADLTEEEELRIMSSIAGQCLHPLMAKDILHRAGLVINSNAEEIEKHAEHIFNFTINGLKSYNRG